MIEVVNGLLPTKLVAGANIYIDPDKLYKLGQLALSEAPAGQAFAGQPAPFWLGQSIRGLDRKSIPDCLKDIDPFKIEVFLRNDERVEWYWIENEVASYAKEVLEPTFKFYKKLTRIKILLQIPGYEVHPHRDITVGNMYDRMDNPFRGIIGKNGLMYYRGPEWLHTIYPQKETNLHAEMEYFALKVPLDLDNKKCRSYLLSVDDFLKPIPDRNYIYYDYQSQPYWLNEVECLHGVSPGEEWRGVIFMDGILDIDKVRENGFTPLKRV